MTEQEQIEHAEKEILDKLAASKKSNVTDNESDASDSDKKKLEKDAVDSLENALEDSGDDSETYNPLDDPVSLQSLNAAHLRAEIVRNKV